MRVTSAPARTKSCAAAAASFTLSEPERSEPGMTRIFNAGMISIAFRASRLPAEARLSALAVHPDAGRRKVHPDPLGSLGRNARQRSRNRRRDRVGELHEGRARSHRGEG